MNEILELDKALFQKINGDWANPLFDLLMPVVTDLHHQIWFAAALFPLIVAVWVFKFKQRALKTLLLVAISIALADAISYRVIKPLVDRPRPQLSGIPVYLRTFPHTGKSFPSNHAANNFAAATILSFAHPPLAPVFFAIAFIVAYSRVYVGVHFPLDILGGAILGIAIALMIWTIIGKRLIKKEKKKVIPLDPMRKPVSRYGVD